MAQHNLDAFDTDLSTRRVFQEFDQAIVESNRTAIMAATGGVTRDQVLRVATAGSRLRARYLAEILKLASDKAQTELDTTAVLDLRQLREAYEEALHGFGVLRHAHERAYVDFKT